jgi:uncharacterized membrane protein
LNQSALFLVVFLACVVEAVEALTIVLAAGVARGWRSAAIGCLAALLCLAVIVAALGPAISAIPLDGLRLFVGGVLLVFGLQWLRIAVLRASGEKAFHDEAVVLKSTLAAARHANPQRPGAVADWYGFTLAFKGVALEGLEVAFIAVTFGANQHNIPLAAVAASLAVMVVGIAGLALRAPLTRVPKNVMKFVVGVLLTAFGLFWSAEGAGAHWPAGDVALLVIIPAVAAYAVMLVALFRRRSPVSHARLGAPL